MPLTLIAAVLTATGGETPTGNTALTSATVAGAVALAVALVTHLLTRTREHHKWHREQVFETAKTLNRHYLAFVEHAGRAPRIPSDDWMYGKDIKAQLDAHDWATLNGAYEGYRAALGELSLLLPRKKVQERVDTLSETMRSARLELQHPVKWNELEQGLNDDPFNTRHHADLKTLEQSHLELILGIKRRFFMPRRLFKR